MAAGGSDVTVVVPAWGRYVTDYLPEALASLAVQDPPPHVIVVDNASNEPVVAAGATVIRAATRLSAGAARNVGLEAVATKYVLFGDADDVMLPGTLDRLRQELERDDGVVAAGAAIVLPSGAPYHWPRVFPRWVHRRRTFAVLNTVTSQYSTIGTLMRADDVRAVGGFADRDAGEDWVLGAMLATLGRIAITPTPGRVYRRHTGSLSADWSTGQLLDSASAVRAHVRGLDSAPWVLRAPALLAPAQWFILLVLRPLRLRLCPEPPRVVERAT
jgi:glycosyltransferase involved in cell wall biosynthesis